MQEREQRQREFRELYFNWIDDHRKILYSEITIAELEQRFEGFECKSAEDIIQKLPWNMRPHANHYNYQKKTYETPKSSIALKLLFIPVSEYLERFLIELGELLSYDTEGKDLLHFYVKLSVYSRKMKAFLCPVDEPESPEILAAAKKANPFENDPNLTKGFVENFNNTN